jgi:tetratricopeptide (TPR) repeat protein
LNLGWCYSRLGQFEQAIHFLEKTQMLNQSTVMSIALAEVLAAAGERAKAYRIINSLSDSSYLSPYWLSRVYLASGEIEKSLFFLEKSFLEREVILFIVAGIFRSSRRPRGLFQW